MKKACCEPFEHYLIEFKNIMCLYIHLIFQPFYFFFLTSKFLVATFVLTERKFDFAN